MNERVRERGGKQEARISLNVDGKWWKRVENEMMMRSEKRRRKELDGDENECTKRMRNNLYWRRQRMMMEWKENEANSEATISMLQRKIQKYMENISKQKFSSGSVFYILHKRHGDGAQRGEGWVAEWLKLSFESSRQWVTSDLKLKEKPPKDCHQPEEKRMREGRGRRRRENGGSYMEGAESWGKRGRGLTLSRIHTQIGGHHEKLSFGISR